MSWRFVAVVVSANIVLVAVIVIAVIIVTIIASPRQHTSLILNPNIWMSALRNDSLHFLVEFSCRIDY